MKIIALILSFYILALNALPCSDTRAGFDDTRIEAAFGTDSGHDHGAFDLCPPFCSCHCCHVHTIDFGATAFTPLPSPISKENFSHFEGVSDGVLLSLLQPPRA
ncbi:MAG TPA: hypothetical protein ENH87_15680 [Pricia antarctica]|uniref:Uncharacterized protein n=1 Tax=Pricia antarctica TaxID=641691 RepID=A0A831QSK4_9FLAO|nr:hypothetical protein [Pricia antarctica]